VSPLSNPWATYGIKGLKGFIGYYMRYGFIRDIYLIFRIIRLSIQVDSPKLD